MTRWILPSGLATAVTFMLFVFMASLIEKPAYVETTSTVSFQDFYTPKSWQPEPEVKKASLPPKVQQKTPPPPPEVIDDFDGPAEINTPDIGIGMDGIGRSTLKPWSSNRTSFSNTAVSKSAVPIIRIEPRYPIEAAKRGLEGWVMMSFTVDKSGAVTDIQVVDSKPQRVFDKAAVQALRRWKYQAKFEQGIAVSQPNQMIRLDFSMNE